MNSRSGVLFNVPSRYLYAIGLETYLGLEVDAPRIPAPFPRSSTLDTHARNLLRCRYGAVTLYRAPFQATLRFPARYWHGSKHHIYDAFQRHIRFALCAFQSLLLGASQLISSPAGTKTFQFPAFPALSCSRGSPIRTSPVQPLHTRRRGISPLAASFIGVSNQVFHLLG